MKWVEGRISFILEKLNNVLANTGLSVPSPNVTQVDGSLNVVGNLNVSGASTVSGTNGIQSSNYVAGTSGWKFNGTSLEANTGVIGNGALANPVTGGATWASSTGFALSTTLTELAGINITVPAGFSQAFGTIGAYVFAYNHNTTGGSNGSGGDAIYAQAQISTSQSRANPIGVSGSGGFATSSSGTGYALTGLTPGSTIRLSVYGSSAYAAMASDASNYANAFASVIWLR
jgi:hypothetical protein